MSGISSGCCVRVISHQSGLIRVVFESGISSGWYLRVVSHQGGV